MMKSRHLIWLAAVGLTPIGLGLLQQFPRTAVAEVRSTFKSKSDARLKVAAESPETELKSISRDTSKYPDEVTHWRTVDLSDDELQAQVARLEDWISAGDYIRLANRQQLSSKQMERLQDALAKQSALKLERIRRQYLKD